MGNGARARAEAWLRRDPVLHANPLEVLRRGSDEALFFTGRGVALLDGASGAWMLAAEPGAAGALMDRMPGGCDTLVGHDLAYLEAAAERWGLAGRQICRSAAYLGRAPLPPLPFPGRLRRLGPEWAGWLDAHYSHSFGGTAYMEGAVRRGMLGAFLEGEDRPAGFVGFHEEGSIGMLEVLPHRRRMGLGEALLRAAVNLALSRGSLPFGQVFVDNAPSLALQKKVGMALSRTEMFWLMREEGGLGAGSP